MPRTISLAIMFILIPCTAAPAAGQAVGECKGAGTPSVPGGCGDVGQIGCCDAFGRVLWCQGGDLYCNDCSDGFEHCGWFDFLQYYDCGAEGPLEDPTGDHPYSCDASCVGCGEGEVCLDDGTCYLPQCQGKECGTDPMGISCGKCGFGSACVEGLFQCLPYPKPCLAGDGPGCGGCACESCVCAKYPNCCTEKWDIFCASACEAECGFDCSPCPAEPACGAIECGGFCGLDCGTCPGGQSCYAGKCCVPDCSGGKECGPNGCGGSCGDCPGTDVCESGACVACQPQCQGKVCGPDGCEGSCGTCPDGSDCEGGLCTKKDSCLGSCGGQAPGSQCWCDEQCKGFGDCCDDYCEACPTLCDCTPDCTGKQCGNDGCGGSCGQCQPDLTCVDGACAEDPCGGYTWEGCCEGNVLFYCQEGQVLDIDCDVQGGNCGWEAANNYYNCETPGEPDPSGTFPMACPGACEPDCSGKECGPDGCEGNCGPCPAKGMVCLPEGTCCDPDCFGKSCGDDGCGGSCGDCPDGVACDGGQCAVPADATEPPTEPAPETPDNAEPDADDVAAEPVESVPDSIDAGETAAPEPVPEVVPDAVTDPGSVMDAHVGWKDTGAADVPDDARDLVDHGTGVGGGACSTGPTGGEAGALPILVLALLMATALLRRRRTTLPAISVLAFLAAALPSCSGEGPSVQADSTPLVDIVETTAKDPGPEGLIRPDLWLDQGAAGEDLQAPTEDLTVADSQTEVADPGDLPGDGPDAGDAPDHQDVPIDAAPDTPPGEDAFDATDATDAFDAPEEVEVPPPYDCSQIPQGPFQLVKVPKAVASEDLAFDGKGNLIGSNNTDFFKSGADGNVKLFVSNVKTRSGLRMLPNGTLAVNDDTNGRVLLFDPDGVVKVLVQGLQYPNGMAVDLQGYIYVTEENAHRVLRIHSYTGEYTVLTDAISHPNGITFNATYDRLFVGSFGTPKIYTMKISPKGVPGKVMVFTEFPSGSLMDGMGVDVCGNLYVCEYGKTEMWRVSPDGKHKTKIVDPDVDTYLPNLQWGRGKGWDPLSLYVPDGWKIGVWRIEIGVPSAPLPFP